MGKQRIGVLLRESVTGTKSSNQWGDLRTLTLKYQGFRQRLRALVVSLQKHHEAILNMEATRRAVSVVMCRQFESLLRTLFHSND